MSRFRDLISVAWTGLSARKIRTLLIMLGPIVGVAAMVGAVGLTESAKGDLKQKLSSLGTNLIIANAGGTFGSQNPSFPGDAVTRVKAISTVTGAAATTNLSQVIALPNQGGSDYYQAFPVPVRAADVDLPAVLDVPVINGRWLSASDNSLHAKSVVLGSGLAKQYAYLRGEARTIRLNDTDFGVVGVLGPVALDPDLDNAVFVTQWAAKHVFSTDGKPNQLYVRSTTGDTQATADAIPTAINLGGPDSVSTKVPSDVLKAASQADKTLQQTALFAGLLALSVGGLGIANVMSISVIQRSSEIGIRRAVGHSRMKIGLQFLLESLFVGVLGGILGAAVGVGVVYLVSSVANWVVVIAYNRIPIWMSLALVVSVVAGLYPSIKAARLEPLETLRLG
ncbi:MAG: putative transport system permease protein [Actinomycetota bacterium]|nr:putative transport system permease protein [Actinomycetota bacterium]